MSNNAENIIGKGFDSRSTEEARELGRKGGINSGIARRNKRNLRLQLEMLLDKEYTIDDKGTRISGGEAVSTKLMQKALKGDVRAFEVLRDTIGQRQPDKIMVAEVDKDVIDEVEKAVLGDDK